MHWTAAPAVPLARLSTAPTATIRSCVLVDGHLQVHGVGPGDRLGLRPLPLREQVHERLVGVRLGVDARRPRRRSRRRSSGRRAGGEDAARHRHQQRREADARPCRRRARTRFWVISGVCRCTPPTPYALALPMTSLPSRCGLAALPAPLVPEAATTTTSGSTSRRRRPGPGSGWRRSGSSRVRRSGSRRRSARAGRAARAGRRARCRRGRRRRTSPRRPGRRAGSRRRSRRRRSSSPQLRRRSRRTGRAAARGRRRRGRASVSERSSARAPGRRAARRCGCSAPSGSPGVGGAGERADLDLGVAEQQPQQLAAGVPAGSGDRDPLLDHAHDYTHVA